MTFVMFVLGFFFFPIKMVKELYSLAEWFFFGDKVRQRDKSHAELYPQYIDTYKKLEACWNSASSDERVVLKFKVAEFAGRCVRFNSTLPPNSPYRLHF